MKIKLLGFMKSDEIDRIIEKVNNMNRNYVEEYIEKWKVHYNQLNIIVSIIN